jgi:hypothetical protein
MRAAKAPTLNLIILDKKMTEKHTGAGLMIAFKMLMSDNLDRQGSENCNNIGSQFGLLPEPLIKISLPAFKGIHP